MLNADSWVYIEWPSTIFCRVLRALRHSISTCLPTVHTFCIPRLINSRPLLEPSVRTNAWENTNCYRYYRSNPHASVNNWTTGYHGLPSVLYRSHKTTAATPEPPESLPGACRIPNTPPPSITKPTTTDFTTSHYKLANPSPQHAGRPPLASAAVTALGGALNAPLRAPKMAALGAVPTGQKGSPGGRSNSRSVSGWCAGRWGTAAAAGRRCTCRWCWAPGGRRDGVRPRRHAFRMKGGGSHFRIGSKKAPRGW